MRNDKKYEALRLCNQMCFPLYACSRAVIRQYRPLLEALDLTYTQYITLMVFWEEHEISAKDLGTRLFLDSGTLTPVLKSLEAKGFVTRRRDPQDERVLLVTVTEAGLALRDQALDIPKEVAGCVELEEEEGKALYKTLYKILEQLN